MFSYLYPLKTLFAVLLLTSLQTNLFIPPGEARPLDWRSFFQTWLNRKDPGKGRDGGSRDPENCLITPSTNQRLWNNRPRFVWQGKRSVVGLRQENSQTLLSKQIASKQLLLKQIQYNGKPLQAGQTYQWLFFFDSRSSEPMRWVSFQIMEERDRAPISADLQALEQQLKAQHATLEAIALQRADYFAQRQLWADVLQEIYGVENPSEELKQLAEKLPEDVCKS